MSCYLVLRVRFTISSLPPPTLDRSILTTSFTVALPADIESPLKLARLASHWMFGLLLAAAVLNFVMIFVAPLAVSARHPRYIKAWAAGYNGTSQSPAGNPPHRRRTFVWLRALPMLILTFFTALVTIVGSAVATVMFVIFANVFAKADPNINIKAHVGTQMLVFMWVACAFSLLAFIIQIGSCCAACCRGHRARKQLKSQGIDWHEKGSAHSSATYTPVEQRAVSSGRDASAGNGERRFSSGEPNVGHGQANGNGNFPSQPHYSYSSTEPHAISG
jgi:hypothetical protein